MLHIELENILSESEATAKIGELIAQVDGSDQIVVVTRNNQPAVALIAVAQLEGLTGRQVLPAAPKADAPVFPEPVSPEPTPAPEQPDTPEVPAAPSLMAAAPEVTPLPQLPDLPDFPGNDVLEDAPAPSPVFQAPSPVPFASPAPVLPPAPSTPVVPTPPAVPTMPGSAPLTSTAPAAAPVAPAVPAVPAPYSVPPADLPDFARNQQDGGGLPPEDLNSSSPLA